MPDDRLLKERVSRKEEDGYTNDDNNEEEEAVALLLSQSLSSFQWNNKMLSPAIVLVLAVWCLLYLLFLSPLFRITASVRDPHSDDDAGVSPVLAHCAVRNDNTTFDEFMTQMRGIVLTDDTNGDTNYYPNDYFCKGVRMGHNRQCRCTQPTQALPGSFPAWFESFDWLKQLAATASDDLQPLHVALLGDSIFDRLNGKLGGKVNPGMVDVHKVFHELFTIQGGGQINGISLGLAGDVVRTRR
jgi:hypothetical protein